MPYGTIKVDNITFTNGGSDSTITVSGIVEAISGNITATGTIQGATIIGTSTVSGATVTGNTGQFTTLTGGAAGFTTVTGVSGIFTSQISGATVTGSTASFTSGTFVSGIFTTQISGATITGNTGNFTTFNAGTANLTSGVFASGTQGAPSLSIGTTTNGLYSPGADQVAISTGGSGRLFVDASGNVGIGTTPDSPLHVVGTSGTGLRIGYTNNTNYFDANTQIFRSNNATTTYGQWDSSGRLLVGTSSTVRDSRLCVRGNASGSFTGDLELGAAAGYASISADNTIGVLRFTESTNGGIFAQLYAESDGTPGNNDYPGRLVFSTTADGASSPTERYRITQDGRHIYSNTGYLYPDTDNAVQLGGPSNRFTAVYAVNGSIQTSDRREKVHIEASALGSDFIRSLRPVSYKWIEGGKRDTGKRDKDSNYIYESVPGQRTHWGFIAQEVKQAVDAAGVDFGGWVLTDKSDPDSQQALRYDQFIAPLTKALQEALAEIDVLKAKVAALESA